MNDAIFLGVIYWPKADLLEDKEIGLVFFIGISNSCNINLCNMLSKLVINNFIYSSEKNVFFHPTIMEFRLLIALLPPQTKFMDWFILPYFTLHVSFIQEVYDILKISLHG